MSRQFEADFGIIEGGVSSDRLSTYLKLAGGDKGKALVLYEENKRASEKLHSLISEFEVVFRNAINDNLTAFIGSNWHESDKLISDKHKRIVRDTTGYLNKNGREVTNSNIVSSLTFGFWLNFFDREYDKTLWRQTLYKIFPRETNRNEIRLSLNKIRNLRNRIAHCECILKLYYRKQAREILELLSKINPELVGWVKQMSIADNELFFSYRESQYYKPKSTEQQPTQVVDVSHWSIGDLTPYSEGARDKSLLESPVKPAQEFIIPSHKYLLKKTYSVKGSDSVLYEQYWNEVIAYKLGQVLQVKVPPAFVAHYQREGSEPFYGSLIEWFYDFGGNDTSRRGGDVITRYIEGYDTSKGELHNFQTLVEIFNEEQVENWLQDLTEMLTFDAIIGNTDRHQDNWQILDYTREGKRLLSPAFDNGTSLGYFIRYDHLDGWENKQQKLANKGYHHMKWQIDDASQANHFELLERLVEQFPECKAMIKAILDNDISTAYDDILELTKFDIADEKYKLTSKRADFIIKMLDFRYNYVKKLLKL